MLIINNNKKEMEMEIKKEIKKVMEKEMKNYWY